MHFTIALAEMELFLNKCQYQCTACSNLLVAGHCSGDLKLSCDDCNFTFRSQKCMDAHRYTPSDIRKGSSRCSDVKLCLGCNTVYRPANGPHICGQSLFCVLCKSYVNHPCSWDKYEDSSRQQMLKKQREFAFGFFDCESQQCTEREDGEFEYGEHVVTTISLCKICYKCEDAPIDQFCPGRCGERRVTFQYKDANTPKNEVVDKFVNYLITDPSMKSRLIYSHNGAKYDQHLIFNGFRRRGFYPKTVNKGSSLIRVEVKSRDRKLVFKDSYCTIPMPLSSFAKSFELDCEDKGTFPHLLNMKCFRGKKWPSIPPKKYFSYKYMKPDQQIAFDDWYVTQIGKEFDQDKELRRYCENDVLLLLKGCMKFREKMIEATDWCPFVTANTLASFCLYILRVDHLNDLEMPYLPEQGYGRVNQSLFALKYIRWRESKLPYDLEHELSSKGERKISIGNHHFSLDCYDPVTHKIIEVLGCWHHACNRCFPPGSIMAGGERAEEVYGRTMRRIEMIKSVHPDIEVHWECEIKTQLLDPTTGMKKFFDEVEIVDRLKIRDGIYGGRVEVMRTYLKATAKTMIKHYDICSLYPAIQSTHESPLGRPEIITSNFKPIVGNTFPYKGIALITILAPSDLKLPVLPVRHEKALFFCLCFSCIKERSERCGHIGNDKARAWRGTYATVEINLALEKGYKVLKIHEVYSWQDWSTSIYRNYFKRLIKLKFASSGFPQGVDTPEQQSEYCAKVGEKLGFTLHPDEVKEDPALRLKLAEVPIHLKTEYIPASEFYNLCLDPNIILTRSEIVEDGNDGEMSGDDTLREETLLVSYKPRIDTIRANRYSATHHAVILTAHSRVLLYRILEKVGSKTAYCDTDSIIFEMDRDGEDPLKHLLTNLLGEMSDECKPGYELDECIFAGCKNYSISLRNLETGAISRKDAFRGVVKDTEAMNILSHEMISDMVLKKTPAHIDIKRPELKRKLGSVKTQIMCKRYRPFSFKRVARGEGKDEIHVPFGYIGDDE
ncbi:hypothetical protein PRIPAC_85696 [Pristionchus pacificus]|uniref:DNA-directed DNA polymerase n=1 Tax=Pristionchus pacificus TaxID=54126 RepID=A0A2A6BSA2_PRIPA|nr:hypothetical protein PRIPAC_85696 [Pristionchus pacificus]|eukprot:PDM68765.1 hypothetical protein PRIPAC_47067 [Pristionchus pacificus]